VILVRSSGKVAKRVARYRLSEVKGEDCRHCRHMHSDGTCAKVEGIVKPDYVSDLFSPQ
jgi:hypothetical protein